MAYNIIIIEDALRLYTISESTRITVTLCSYGALELDNENLEVHSVF